MPRWPALALLPLLLVGAAGETSAYFANWGEIGGRPQEPTCVDIPQDMPLCSGIDYSKMRLPNLLEHDTLKEAQQQAGYWVPLLNLRCHPNTQLFLCSLFTPVCLESPIYPCRSLCEAVRNGCESRMQTYSFPWPDMLSCDKFPLDNDMCITVQHTAAPGPERVQEGDCPACSPVETYENILDNYCRADLVLRARVKRKHKNNLLLKKSRRLYKSRAGQEEDRRALRRLKFSLTEEAGCCSVPPSRKPYLIMGRRKGTAYIPTFVLPLKKSKPLRQAMKMFRNGLNCSDPNLITNNLEGTALSQEPPQRVRPSSSSPGPNGPDPNGRGSTNRGSGGRTTPGRPRTPGSRGTSNGRKSSGRRRCFRKCRKSCQKKCRSVAGKTCTPSCGKSCRGNCRKGRKGRGRGGNSRRNHRVTGNNRQSPQDIIPLSDITSEITNFAPADIERPEPELGDN